MLSRAEKMENKIEKLMQYYNDNPDDFADDIEELDDYNGCLGGERRHPMDELYEIYDDADPTEILRRAHFGYDDDSWHDEDGEMVRGEFNPTREYIYINGYGNFVSTSDRDYRDGYLEENYVQDIIDASQSLGLSDGAQKIIDEQDDE